MQYLLCLQSQLNLYFRITKYLHVNSLRSSGEAQPLSRKPASNKSSWTSQKEEEISIY